MKIPVILGPTAIGKTNIAIELAQKFNLEVVSCDSRQIYKYMNVGTSKPTVEEQHNIKHYLMDVVEPSESYSAYQYAKDAIGVIRKIKNKGKVPVICGGTGLYFKVLSEGAGPQIKSDIKFRERMEKKAEIEGVRSLFNELEQVDPVYANRIHHNDLYRVIRALQVYNDSQIPYSEHLKNKKPLAKFDFSIFILTMSRNVLYNRINKRVDLMFANGLYDEFIKLNKMGYNLNSPGMQTIGYRELFNFLSGKADLETVTDSIKRNTRKYAKRQITWFTGQITGKFIDVSDYNNVKSMHDDVRRLLQM